MCMYVHVCIIYMYMYVCLLKSDRLRVMYNPNFLVTYKFDKWKQSNGLICSKTQLTAMCSLDKTGWNPTKEICMDRIVPRQYT